MNEASYSRTPRSESRMVFAFLVFFGAFALYLHTLGPTLVPYRDAGEMATGVTRLGVGRARAPGTFEQLVVTPISKTSIVLGKLLPFVVIGYVQMACILILGRLLWNIPIRGSVLLLFVLSLGFIVANLGVGLFVSTLVSTQIQAMQLSVFFLLPNILLSGFMFPREAMPAVAQWISYALPLTYYLTVLRGILLKGIGFSHLWHETLILVAFATALIVVSVRRFSKTVG